MEKQNLIDIVNYRKNIAFDTINESESHLANGFLNTAMNRIYYAGFYIVSALAVIDNFSTSKHKQLIGYFNKNYIKNGIIDKRIGEIFNLAFENRQALDYQDFVLLTKSQIENYRVRMNEFINHVNLIIEEKLKQL